MRTNTILLLDSDAADAERLEQLSLAIADAGFDVHFLTGVEDLSEYLTNPHTSELSCGVVLIAPGAPTPLATAARVAHHAPSAEIIILTDAGAAEELASNLPRHMHLEIANPSDPGFADRLRGAAERGMARMRSAESLSGEDAIEPTSTIVSDHYLASILAQAQDAIISTDVDGVVLTWNRGARRVLAHRASEAIGRPVYDLAGGAWRDQLPALIRIVRQGGVIGLRSVELTRIDGARIEVEISLAPVRSDAGTLAGISIIARDITAVRRIEQKAAAQRREEIEVILEGVADGITAQDLHGRIIYANLAAARLSGFDSVEEFLATPLTELMGRFEVMDEDGSPLSPDDFPGRKALAGEESPEQVMKFRILATGEERWAVVKARPVLDQDGSIRFAINIFRDITHLKEVEERLRFLAGASAVLSSSLDYETTLASVALLAVPKIADWAAVDIITDDGKIERLAVAHVDPEKIAFAQEFNRRYPPNLEDPTGLPAVLRSGRSEFYPVLTDEMFVAAKINDEWLEMIRQVGFSSVMIVPLVVRGKPIGAITLVHAESGRHYTEADLALAEDLARRASIAIDNAWLHSTSHEQREWLRVTLSSIGDAVIATDIEGRVTFLNSVAERLTGWTREEAIGGDLPGIFQIVNEESRMTVENPVEKVIRTGMVVGLANHTVLIARDGTEIPIDDSAAPIMNGDGEMIGVVMVFHDITERRRAEMERTQLLERERRARAEAEENERQYRSMAEAMPQIVWTARPDGYIDYCNSRWLEYTSLSLEESLGFRWTEVLHRDDRARTEMLWRRAVQTGELFEGEYRLCRASDSSYRWHLGRAVPVRGEDGAIVRWIGTATDIEDQKSAEDQLQFLAAASEILSSSLDYTTTLASVAQLAVPKISDWASVDMVAPDGSIQRLAVAHVDPEKVKWAHELQRRYPMDPDAPSGAPNVIRTGRSEFYPLITEEMITAAAQTEEQLRIMQEIGFRSAMTVPLIVRGEPRGAISFISAESGRLYNEGDLALAEDLARRAGAAIENAELFSMAQIEVAERRRAEHELAISERRLRMMIEQSPLSIQIFTHGGDLIQANRAWETLWDTSREQLAGYNILEDRQLVEKGIMPYIRRAFAGEAIATPAVMYDPADIGRDGRPRWVRAVLYPVIDDDGQPREVVLILEDVTESRMAEEAIRESEERFRSMADRAPVLIWMVGPDGLATYFNDTWLEFTGRPFAEEVGNGWIENIHPDDVHQRMEAFRAAFAGGAEFQLEYRMRRSDGEYRWLLDTGIPRFSADNRFAGYIGSCIDITDRKQAEIDLERAKNEAEAANQAKDQFLAVLSHELRTPLTPVLTLTQALREDDLPDDVRAYIDIIDRNIGLEARLIDDLLDLTRIEKGKLQLNFETVDAHALVNNVLEIYREEILAKKLSLSVDLGAARHFVRADPARLQQIFWNLVKNAVKFTPEGGRIFVRSFDDDRDHLVVEVTDTGIGIDPEVLPQIFAAFEQGDQVITRRFGGLGLGLAISKALVEMHGGWLSASSDGRNQGATFTVELATTSPGNDVVDGMAEPGARSGERPAQHILLVDDHEDTSKVMKVLLERRGYQVTTAATMQAGIEAAMNGRYDLLISDIGLPDGSGLDLMTRLVSSGRPIKGIALSGFGMEEDIRRSKEVGFIEHLTKPVSFQKLQEIIEQLIGERR